MELVKDIIKVLLGGIAEFGIENKISEKRREYFRQKSGKWAKICFWGSVILALGLLAIGLWQILQKKVTGILLLCTGMAVGLFMLAEWGTADQ